MESLLNKEPVKRAQKALKDFDQSLGVTVLDSSAKTAIDAAKYLKCDVGAIIKSLLLRTGNTFLVCLVAGDKRCSLNKIKKIINKKDVSMALPEQVKNQTGYTIGGVSPIGHINKLEIIIDNTLERFKDLYAAAGNPNCVFKIDFKNLQIITNGEIKELTE